MTNESKRVSGLCIHTLTFIKGKIQDKLYKLEEGSPMPTYNDPTAVFGFELVALLKELIHEEDQAMDEYFKQMDEDCNGVSQQSSVRN